MALTQNEGDRPVKLVTLQRINEAEVHSISPSIDIVRAERDSVVQAARDADILIGDPGEFWPEILNTARKLKWVHVGSAGVDGLICPELRDSEVLLTCAKGDIAGPVLAEHAFALLFSLTRGIARSVRGGQWSGAAGKGVFELGGKTVGLVGFGGVGRHLARIAQGLEMEVLAVRRSPEKDGVSGVSVWGTDRLLEMLAVSDVVIVSVPDTRSTRGMLNRHAFQQMKKSAILIAVGRGRTVDTEDLVAALQQGEISGAGLDVVDPEPLPQDHPLWQMDNVILTPHIAGNSPERQARNQDLILRNLKRFVKGEPLENQVDKNSGY
jgi:phosphoglycerate dehydrogenase-like enzyme